MADGGGIWLCAPAPPRPAFPFGSQFSPWPNPSQLRRDPVSLEEINWGGSCHLSGCLASPTPTDHRDGQRRQGWATGPFGSPWLHAWFWQGFPEASRAGETLSWPKHPCRIPTSLAKVLGALSGCLHRPVSHREGPVHRELHPHHPQGPGMRKRRRMVAMAEVSSPWLVRG